MIMKVAARGQILAEIKKKILKIHLLEKLIITVTLDLIAMISLNYVARKCKGSYEFKITQQKINQLMYMNDIKIFCRK